MQVLLKLKEETCQLPDRHTMNFCDSHSLLLCPKSQNLVFYPRTSWIIRADPRGGVGWEPQIVGLRVF